MLERAMRHALTRHPDFACRAVERIAFEARRTSAGLALAYTAEGNISALRLPPPASPARTDELWKHTCFEIFARVQGAGYAEFNFAPSTHWAAYAFDGYRAGMRDLPIDAPRIETLATAMRFEMRVALALPPELRGAPLRLAASAVIEEASGDKSYWALAHPAGRPDFHHDAGFVLDLPPEQT